MGAAEPMSASPSTREWSPEHADIVLEAKGIAKEYAIGEEIAVRALDGVSFQIHRGDLIAIIGPSGSGKSTLMHSIGLLDRPTEGQILVGDTDVTDMSPNQLATVRNREIGFVFQAFNLLARTTAMENVELPLIYAGVSASERKRRARAALERVGLGDRLNHVPNQLSGGQQQRVAIARALVTEPAIVLADEPTGNLDSKSGKEVMAFLQELNRSGVTVVLVTHDNHVASHARRIVTMRDGQIVEDRTLAEGERVDAALFEPALAVRPEIARGARDLEPAIAIKQAFCRRIAIEGLFAADKEIRALCSILGRCPLLAHRHPIRSKPIRG